ncbi:MAG: PIG-L family deacetylase [Desulfobacteraceae bacterium]|nr:PIG-L family deacetylase [Desulfobacteraceae bacterium]
MDKKILVVAAHPDDEVLGCGGTIAKLANKACEVYTLLLGRGIAARCDDKDCQDLSGKTEELRRCTDDANRIIGVKKVFSYDFPDNRFDLVALLDIVKVVEEVKNRIKPDIIFTHYEKDLNIDHRITYEAVITATRPQPDETVKEIYSFEVLSSTEWNYPLSFLPDVFFDISETMDLKLKALGCYKTELREFPHPRSSKGAESNAKTWGMKLGIEYAEAFKCVRCLR